MPITTNDPADFTPTRGSYKELSPFRFWCQKVLPLVYDDSLSYYELLNKVVNYLNMAMEDVTTLEGDVTNLHTAYVQLQTYVNDYFVSLDVQEEINNKLNTMASDGTLSDLLEPFIPTIITDWLDENITPTSPPIDASLTVEGAGADAKVTGETFNKYGELDNTRATALTSESDVNNLPIGSYVIANGSVASALNMPLQAGGKFYVLAGNASNRYAQMFIASDSYGTSLFLRWYNGSSWTEWTRNINENIANELIENRIVNKYLELGVDNTETLTENSDVNNLSVGNYRVGSASVAIALNLPINSGGRLYVLYGNANNRNIQIFLAEAQIYIRKYDGANWSAWSDYPQTKNVLHSTNFTVASTADLDDFNNAPINAIIAVNRVDIPNAPEGDGFVINAGQNHSFLRGMLLTYSPQTIRGSYNQIVQIFCGYYGGIDTNYADLCMRIAMTSGSAVVWSPWSKFSQDKFLGASNIVLRASNASEHFTNLNDAPINTIYQIDKDCVEGTLTNHPAPGYSCVLMTYAFAVSTRHGIVQTLYSVESGEVKQYIRYGWLNAVNDYRFTPWRRTVTEAV